LEWQQYPEAATAEEELEEIALSTQTQLRSIVQECKNYVMQLRMSMKEDLSVLRRSVEAMETQLDTVQRRFASDVDQRETDSVSPKMLAAAISALEQHVNQYRPSSRAVHFIAIILDQSGC
jgi:uncharacterized protein Yka (UPF0111/DUF47 family)